YPPCLGATPSRYRAVGVAGSLGTGQIADMAVMGEGRRHREKGCPQGPRIRLEPRRVRVTKVLVSRRGRRRKAGRGVVAASKCDGAGSRRMGVAHHGE